MFELHENADGKVPGNIMSRLMTWEMLIIIVVIGIMIVFYFYTANAKYAEKLKKDLEGVYVFVEFCEQGSNIHRDNATGFTMKAVAGINVTVPRIQSWIGDCCVISYNETSAIIGLCSVETPCGNDTCQLLLQPSGRSSG